MRFAFFGSSLVSTYWNGAATYYRGLIRELARRGHSITFYEPDAYERQQHRDLADPPWARVVVYAPTEADAARCLDAARTADLVVKTSGVGVLDAFLEASVLDLAGHGRGVVFWDVDAPATLARLEHDQADPFRALVPRYDAVLTYGGGTPVVRRYLALGARRCVPIYNGLDPGTHHPVPIEPRFAGALGFLGNRLPDREHRVEELFLRAAAGLPAHTCLLGGAGWKDKARPASVRLLGHVGSADHNAFNCSVDAVLNITRDDMAALGWSPATRVFEAAGAGACVITDAWPGIEDFFEPGKEILVAASADEIIEHVLTTTPARRRALGNAALRRALAEHTYAHRVNALEHALAIEPATTSGAGGRSPP